MKILFFIPLLLSSCVVASADKISALGGKGAYKSKSFSLVWDDQKSFRDASVAVTAIAAAAYSAATSAAAETTTQIVNTNAAKVASTQAKTSAATAINASNNATKVSIKALEVAPVAP